MSSIGEKLSKKLTEFFTKETIDAIARETKFVERSSEKIDGPVFLDLLTHTKFDQKELSLNDLSVQLKSRYDVEISKQGIDNRFSVNSVHFVKSVLERFLKEIIKTTPPNKVFGHFNRVRIKDSTCFQLPEEMVSKYRGSGGKASRAMIRIQFEYDYKSGQVLDLSLHPFNEQDSSDARNTKDNIESGDLILRDLGYIIIEIMRDMISKGASVLNRLPAKVNVYEKKDETYHLIDFVELEKELRKNNFTIIAKEVYIGENEKLKLRMIVELLPEEEVNKRRAKAKKKAKSQGTTLGKRYLSHEALNIFITNVEAEILPLEEVRTVYRLRWQIELIFKIWKSIGKVDKVKKMRTERFETVLYAKLLWISIHWSILWVISKQIWQERKELISIIKIFKTFKDNIDEFRQILKQGALRIRQYIDSLYQMSPKNHLLESKKDKLSSLDILLKYDIQS